MVYLRQSLHHPGMRMLKTYLVCTDLKTNSHMAQSGPQVESKQEGLLPSFP